MGIAQKLLDEVLKILREKSIDYLTIFTRDDQSANLFYQKNDAQLVSEHFRVIGQLKQSPYQHGQFFVDHKDKRIGELDAKSASIPYSPDYPHSFWVYDEKDLYKFDRTATYKERTYVVHIK